jgi:S1-C subfamily serine protease
MKKATKVRWGAGAVAASLVVLACGGARPAPVAIVVPAATASATTAPQLVRETVVPRTCAARTKLAQLLGHNEPPPPAVTEQISDMLAPPTSVASSVKLQTNQAYRVAAPLSVLIRGEKGFGTGVVIDAKGYILTNYHVVADGRKKDFVTSVDVTFGDLTRTGRMNRQTQTYEADVVKFDSVRDLAIVKLKAPPPKLTAIKFAQSAPQIGEKVVSIGHAGIGFLWAAKTCSVASVGERQQDSSIIAGLECNRTDPALTPEQATRKKAACDEQKKQMVASLSSKTQGLAVQTDCAITHGDSGGPLVNMAGEVVGLNQSITADVATASFHVHIDEIREFSEKFPDAGIAILPDPYCDGGFDPSLEDLDLDGVTESLVAKGGGSIFGGYDRMSLLLDLDQDQSKRKSGAAGFDAEIALLVLHGATYVWYDTDNDDHFDVLLVDKDSDGAPEAEYRIDANGRVTEDKEKLPKHDVSAKFIKDTALHARLGKVVGAIGGDKYVSTKMLAAAADTVSIPDPYVAGGNEGRAVDSDGNGKADLVMTRGAFTRVTFIDADEDSVGSLKSGDTADALLKAKKVDAEIALVVQGDALWTLYDTNNDGTFDLILMARDSTFASAAWRVSGKDKPVPAPEQIGRKVLRPGLVEFARADRALNLLAHDVATDEALGALPSPTPSKSRFRALEVKGTLDGTVLESELEPWDIQLFDVDHNSKIAQKKPVDWAQAVKDGKFEAEVAVVRHATSEDSAKWVYYDTDADGHFDLVLFAPKAHAAPTQAFRVVKKDGKSGELLEVDSSAVSGRLFRHKSVFKDKVLAARWKSIANQVFKDDLVEP